MVDWPGATVVVTFSVFPLRRPYDDAIGSDVTAVQRSRQRRPAYSHAFGNLGADEIRYRTRN